MNVLELKNLLVYRISEINDVNFLNALKTILDTKSDNQFLQLSPEQQQEILASRKDIEQGLFVDQEELDEEIKLWLDAK